MCETKNGSIMQKTNIKKIKFISGKEIYHYW